MLLGPALEHLRWRIALYAVLSLTLVRIAAVALAMLRSGARWPTVAFLGSFGPRGLASIVFAVIAVQEARLTEAQTILLTTYLTVGLSVIAHGLTAARSHDATPGGTSLTLATANPPWRAPRRTNIAPAAPRAAPRLGGIPISLACARDQHAVQQPPVVAQRHRKRDLALGSQEYNRMRHRRRSGLSHAAGPKRRSRLRRRHLASCLSPPQKSAR